MVIYELKQGKIVNLCFEKYGNVKPFFIESIFKSNGLNYARVKEITIKNIESKEFDLSKLDKCQVTKRRIGNE